MSQDSIASMWNEVVLDKDWRGKSVMRFASSSRESSQSMCFRQYLETATFEPMPDLYWA